MRIDVEQDGVAENGREDGEGDEGGDEKPQVCAVRGELARSQHGRAMQGGRRTPVPQSESCAQKSCVVELVQGLPALAHHGPVVVDDAAPPPFRSHGGSAVS